MVYKLAAFFAGRLPQDLSESITEWLVRFQYAFRFRSRRIIRTNLRMALGKDPSDREIHRLARRTFSNFGRSIYYFLRLPSVPRAEIKRRCEFNGIETITQRLVGNGGCIFVGPHLGAWETGGACLSALGVKLFTVALPHPSRQVTHFFNQQRAMLGIECCSPEHSANRLRGILREGKCVALLVDRVCGGRAASFRWFDKKVELPVGHLALAVRCDVPVVTTACVFDGKERFKFIFGGPHYPKKDLGHSEAMMDLQEKCLADMTDLIRRYPDQWFHFQPFGGGTNGKGHERHS